LAGKIDHSISENIAMPQLNIGVLAPYQYPEISQSYCEKCGRQKKRNRGNNDNIGILLKKRIHVLKWETITVA
jgi:hypothetical protein